ncbi:MAG: hypothetical protein WD491_00950 [Balneolales bacterium]
MATINKKIDSIIYSPSVNIIRDSQVELTYIPTPNAEMIFKQLANDYHLGIRSFCAVGAYGTGKSAFIWALEKSLNGEGNYFKDATGFSNVDSFEFCSLIGEHYSLINAFAELFEINLASDFRTQNIIHQIDNHYNKLKNDNKGLVVAIDEFGKYLEYAAKHDPEHELYFIQQLAEYVNDPKREILLLTTLHQDFNAYSLGLGNTQRYEWDKVKGRLKELEFNEPVEQLLYLASERLSSKNILKNKDSNFSSLFNSIKTANAFPLRDYFNEKIAEKLLPFDILSAATLTLALQRYGQNERSLFSFLESNDYLGLNDFDTKQQPYYNLSKVYEYLLHNFSSLITTTHNPDYEQWAAIRLAIERSENVVEDAILIDSIKMLKTIGLMNIFSSGAVKMNKTFLRDYGKYSLGIEHPDKVIKALDDHKIIRYVNHQSKYKIFEGTDLNINLAIDKAGGLVEQVSNVVYHLDSYFKFPFIPAKAIHYKTGTPRIFKFRLSEDPIEDIPEGELDGFINLVFSDKDKAEEDIKNQSLKCKEAILYGWYKKTSEIKSLIFEIEKIKKVREQNPDDNVARRELDSIAQHQINLLNHYVLGSLYAESSPVCWYYEGKKVDINNLKKFNRQLSTICDSVYHKTPIFKNELVNKTKLSGAISNARRDLISRLIEKADKEHLGYDEKKFPPGKTIYLSLLKETGIHQKSNDGFLLDMPQDKSFQPLWHACDSFLNSSKVNKRNLIDLVQILLAKPFKLKQGYIEFWLPLYLLINKDKYALFGPGGYIPFLTSDTLELLVKNTEDFSVKAFDVDGVKLSLFNSYRNLLEQSLEDNPTNEGFIQTIKPFLIFYRDLPDYAKKTKRLSTEALALREAIFQSQDPEKTFFEDFPRALNYSIVRLQNDEKALESYIDQLQNGIQEIRTCYDELQNRIEQFLSNEVIGEDMVFPNYKDKLKSRFKGLKNHLLLPKQKLFFQRITSSLDHRTSWLSSVCQAVVDKSMENISDHEEILFYEKFEAYIHELDNLCEISKEDVDLGKEDVFQLEIISFIDGVKKNLIRLPKSKTKENRWLEDKIKSKLLSDKQLNIYILTKLLQEQLNEK